MPYKDKEKEREYQKLYRAENREKIREYYRSYRAKFKTSEERKEYWRRWRAEYKEKQRFNFIHRRYGLSREEYEALIESQGNLCPITLEPLTDPVIDHDHDTGRVRGIIQRRVNFGLGNFKDNIEELNRAVEYLTNV